MLNPTAMVFLIDVDNTLLDNDRFVADLSDRLDLAFGQTQRQRYWRIYDELRSTLGYADYLGTLQRFRAGVDSVPALLSMSAFLLDYPFVDRLYPQSLAALKHLAQLGTTVILSDGDIVFQPRKIERSGLSAAVAGRVQINVHKERMLAATERRFPAQHYVMIDDKLNLLIAMKRILGDLLTTVWVRQGHYAAAADQAPGAASADLRIDDIGALCRLALADFHAPATNTHALRTAASALA